MADALKKRRSTCKANITKSDKTLQRLIRERNLEAIQTQGEKMKKWFAEFDAYIETLIAEPEQEAASEYYDLVYACYINQLDYLNDAVDAQRAKEVTVDVQANTALSANKTLMAISQIINLPKLS